MEFIAGLAYPEQGANLVVRDRPAVARTLRVPVSSVDITGSISD
ncbi:hypothetical protein [Paraburkholderia terrae]|nr:hypothetical protein [Paraburkholderia terrae]